MFSCPQFKFLLVFFLNSLQLHTPNIACDSFHVLGEMGDGLIW